MSEQSFKNQAANLLADHKALDITHLSVKELTPLFDDMFVCTATSSRHAKSIAEHIIKHFKPQMPNTPRSEGLEACDWVLIDLNDVVIHVMLKETRELYRLEQLWQISSIPDKE